MSNESTVTAVAGFLGGLVLGAVFTGALIEDRWRAIAIEHRIAIYNESTGVFELKTPREDGSE